MQRILRIVTRLDLKHEDCRRARISRGYKAGEVQPHYLKQPKYENCGRDRTPQMFEPQIEQ